MRRSIRWSTGVMIVLFTGAIAYNLFFIQSAMKRTADGRAVVVEPDRLGELAAYVATGERRRARSSSRMVRVSVRPEGIGADRRDAARAALVLAAQRQLKELGFYAGPLDGRLGPATRRAILAFQKRLGMKATGRPDQATLDRLRYELTLRRAAATTATTTPAGATTLTTARVRALQKRLAELGYDPGPADGRFGPATRRALSRFQADRNLPATGRPDAAALRALGL